MLNKSEIFLGQQLNSEESSWSVKDGYKSKDNFKVYPHRALSNTGFGLNVVLSLKNSDLDFMCKGPVQGFKFKIHSPNEYPDISEGYLRIPLNEEVIVNLKPEMIIDETKSKQNCHTSNSKVLKYFKHYSQSHCLEECRSDFVKRSCGCVKFNMPHDEHTKLCTQHSTKCIINAIDEFSTVYRFKEKFPCDCKPSCSKLTYNAEVSSAIFNFEQVFRAYNESLDGEFPQAIMSRLSIFFKNDHYTLRRLHDMKEQSEWSQKVSQVGGIMALFLGASIISVIEIFYWIFRKIFL